MRRIAFVPLALALAGVAAACGANGGPASPTAEAPTTLTLEKTMVETGKGEFRFTLTLTNGGDNPALDVTTSDVWEEGLEVLSIGSVEGRQPDAIGDFGLEFIFPEFSAAKTVDVVYTARCVQSGEWENVAVSSAANTEPAQAAVTVDCP